MQSSRYGIRSSWAGTRPKHEGSRELLVFEHTAELISKLGSILMTVHCYGVSNCSIEYLFLGA